MTNKVLLAFAMKEELAPWRRGLRPLPTGNLPPQIFTTSTGKTEVYAGLLGAGCKNLAFFEDVAQTLQPSLVIVTGVAAGLKEQWRPGDILAARCVKSLDVGVGEIPSDATFLRLALECGASPGTLVTIPRIARTVEEKTKLTNIADAADMEGSIIMSSRFAMNVPCIALRVILDPVEMPMRCDFEAAMNARGQVQLSKILAQLACNPSLLPEFLHLARESRRVLKLLAAFLDRFLEQVDRQLNAPGR